MKSKALKIAVAAALCAVGTGARSAEWADIGRNVSGNLDISIQKSTLRVEIENGQPVISAMGRFFRPKSKQIYFYQLRVPGSVCDIGYGTAVMADIGTGETLSNTVVLGGGNLYSAAAEYMCEFFNRNREGDSL